MLATLALIILVGASCSTTSTTSTITTDKSSYEIGEKIQANYSIVEEIKDNAWLGIVPANTPHGDEEDGDAVDVDYKYLSGSKEGTMEFSAPLEIGDYQFRVYNDDGSGAIELSTSATFTITN